MGARNEKYILNVKITSISLKEVLENIKSFLLSDSQHYIVTLNPEMVVEAQKNDFFKSIINESDLSIADGVGILLANKFLNRNKLPERIKGIDLIYNICGSEFIGGKKIYLLGAEEGIAKRTETVLRNKYPYLDIVGAEKGISFEMPNYKLQITNEALIQRINKSKPDILFAAFGAPKQEIWIYENIKKIPSVRLAMGVGGSFDFISGKIKRAPRIMQELGLEWFWRLIQEPRRITRIYNATVRFGYLVAIAQIKNVSHRIFF